MRLARCSHYHGATTLGAINVDPDARQEAGDSFLKAYHPHDTEADAIARPIGERQALR
jgi:hypothetical protein